MSGHTSQKDRAWLLPEAGKDKTGPGLYIIATPIGNLGDITLRALDTLSRMDLVICEDTRVSGKLLQYYGIKKSLLPYNDHNAAGQRGPILQKLEEGRSIALISDAGTPLVSDPGYKLIRACVERNIPVTALPGANSVLTALQLSGLPSDAFCFLGFLPPKTGARKKILEAWKTAPASLIVFETAPRLEKSLEDILATLGDREIAVARELTKMFEETRRGKVSELIEYYKAKGAPKGEIVLVIGGAAEEIVEDKDIEVALKKALKTMGVKEASVILAKQTGRSRGEIYDMALRISKRAK